MKNVFLTFFATTTFFTSVILYEFASGGIVRSAKASDDYLDSVTGHRR